MLRVGPRGNRSSFKPISWDEALDLVATKYQETREKYGPYSVWCDGLLGVTMDYWGPFLPGGALGGWAIDSYEPHDFADDFLFGNPVRFWDHISGDWWSGCDSITMLDSRYIVLWGYDVLLNDPEHEYYFLLAKSKGTPIIVIDPRLTWTAQAADQWIPIRPGTDGAMLEAMGYTFFDEDIYNHEFVEKWVEPEGLQRWKEYLYGKDDGIVKTPEWAESICGVPAETIRAVARVYANEQPIYSRFVWSAARMLHGENQTRTYGAVMSMVACMGQKGTTGGTLGHGSRTHFSMPMPPYIGTQPASYETKNLIESELWAKAIVLREKLDAGKMSEDDYKAEIGCPLSEPSPNIKMMFIMQNARNFIVDFQDCNERIQAVNLCDFVVLGHYDWTNTTTWYCDLVLPLAHQFFEGGVGLNTQFGGGFNFGTGLAQGVMNYFIGADKIIDPPGETRHKYWIAKEVANRLGIGDLFAPKLKDVPWEGFFDTMKELARESYEEWRNSPEIVPLNPPTWKEFEKEPVFRSPVKEYNVWLKENFENDIPFKTESGKIEFYSKFLAEKDLTRVRRGEKCFGKGTVLPLPKYKQQPVSMLSNTVREYPLYLVTPHSFYRQHFAQDGNPWFNDEYRTSVWLSAADAQARGIKDGDLAHVYSDRGEMIIPAYVTSRIMPGVTCVIFGRQYAPSNVKTDLMPDGVDRRGSCNFLISNDHHEARRGVLLNNALCEVVKADAVHSSY
jgi:anaerobic dimethyl sulfoxide reductase subunit A